MSRKKETTLAEQPDHDLLNHLHGLGLTSIEAYQDWCEQNGFSRKLHKSWQLRCRERYFLTQAAAEQRLRTKKKEKRREIDLLLAICRHEVTIHDVTQPHLQRLCNIVQPSKRPREERHVDRGALSRLITHVHRCRTKLFDNSPAIQYGDLWGRTYLDAMAMMAAYAPWWLREVEDWKPRTRSVTRQFASLVRHLFVQYDDVPRFFDSVWFAGETDESAKRRKWYVHVGKGQSVRTCDLPISFTKKMAHHFMLAPNDLSIDQALRWGQIHGLGGDECLARAILGTHLAENFQNDDFWTTVIRWLISHPMLDRVHVGPIIDYLNNQRFQPAPGYEQIAHPAQPNLTMKGRTPESLLARVEHWHRGLVKEAPHRRVREWTSTGIPPYEFEEGAFENYNWKRWTIRELLSSRALLEEGRRMNHCVATYDRSCASGHCSIWSMEIESHEGISKALTIEVNNQGRTICQARGRRNRELNDKERSILLRWADEAGLRISRFL